MIVMKFGGTSVGSPEMIKKTAEIISGIGESKVVVVSAMSGITNLLISAARKAEAGDKAYKNDFEKIVSKENLTMKALFGKELSAVSDLLSLLENLLDSIYMLGELTNRALDAVQSFGERMNIYVVSEELKRRSIKSLPVEASKFLITNEEFGNAFPNFKLSKVRADKLFSRYFKEHIIPVITGFIGATPDGRITTLGRGGSDFSATIIGNLLDAREVWIWTDVDGVMSADPRIVKNARSLRDISYNEASELSYFGAKVIHPKALLPVIDKKIPVRILNTFDPSFVGTLITEKEEGMGFVKAITRIKDISLINVNGKGMLGVPGIAARVFSAAAEAHSNVLMISQSSSEQNICFAAKAEDAAKLILRLKKEFEEEMKEGIIESINEEKGDAIVSAVGAGIKSFPGISGKVFSILGRNGINVSAIAQGSSEYNVSFVVKERFSEKAINALHAELGLDNPDFKVRKVVKLFQFGVGSVGSALYKLIEEKRTEIEEKSGVRIQYVGIARSSGYITGNVERFVKKNGFNFKSGRLPEKKILSLPQNSVIVDVTNSDKLTGFLIKAINRNINVVTSNKKNLIEFDNFLALTNGRGIFKFETTVGAALPIIKTLNSILQSGDTVERITALPSGSLSFIFALTNHGKPFKEALKEAKERHYTEPNPMDDLKGTDIFRKAKILLHVLGRDDEVEFEEFVSADEEEEFLKGEIEIFEQKIKKLMQKGFVFPVLEISKNTAAVRLKAFDNDSPFANLRPGENLFEIYTARYCEVPIVIKGLGAGDTITASGVLNDIIEIGREL